MTIKEKIHHFQENRNGEAQEGEPFFSPVHKAVVIFFFLKKMERLLTSGFCYIIIYNKRTSA